MYFAVDWELLDLFPEADDDVLDFDGDVDELPEPDDEPVPDWLVLEFPWVLSPPFFVALEATLDVPELAVATAPVPAALPAADGDCCEKGLPCACPSAVIA